MEDKEEWRPVVGYEGRYEVSSFGRVRSLDRIVRQKNRVGILHDRFYRGVVLSGRIGDRGYRYHVLCRQNKRNKTFKEHFLVAASFLGERPRGKVIDHINGDKTDNRIENLQYISQTDNILKWRNGIEKTGRTSSFAGVSVRNGSIFCRKSWRHNGSKRCIHRFGFKSEKEAHIEYLKFKDLSRRELNEIWEAENNESP